MRLFKTRKFQVLILQIIFSYNIYTINCPKINTKCSCPNSFSYYCNKPLKYNSSIIPTPMQYIIPSIRTLHIVGLLLNGVNPIQKANVTVLLRLIQYAPQKHGKVIIKNPSHLWSPWPETPGLLNLPYIE